MDTEREKLLSLVPAYRRGELSPTDAHRVAQLLEKDKQFRLEAEREELVVGGLAGMKSIPMPRGLVVRAVRNAVGATASDQWFSLDTLLVALGIGVACGASAQLLSARMNIVPIIGQCGSGRSPGSPSEAASQAFSGL